MSEYQYYEFQAVDRPLTEREQDAVANLSSRVVLSPHSAVFTYSYGDFPGDPVKVLEKYFDALLYLANWGSRHLWFRLPRELVKPEELKPYCLEDVILVKARGEHIVVGICLDEEEGGGWVKGAGQLTALLPLRQQILEGDYRALYLAWLKATQFADPVEDDQVAPPVPPGLRSLSAPLKEFVAFFAIDRDAIAAAAKTSAKAPSEIGPNLEEWVSDLPQAEQEDFLRRMLRGEAAATTALRRRLRELARTSPRGVRKGTDSSQAPAQRSGRRG